MAWKREGNDGRGAWYISVTIQDGGRPLHPDINTGVTDKKAAEEIERKVNKLIAVRASGEQPGPELGRWIESMPLKLRQRLIDLGILDTSRAALSKPLREHVADYIAHCRFEGQDATHVKTKQAQLGKLLAALGANRLTDLTRDAVQSYLRTIKDRPKGNSNRTVNHHLSTTVSFLNWCVEVGRLQWNPLQGVKRLDEEVDRRRRRRAATEGELDRFIATASPKRLAVYLVAVHAGPRRGELKRLLVSDVDLERATLRFRPQVSKARRQDVVQLHPQVVDILRAWIPADAKPTDPLFSRVPTRRTFYRDLERAGISIVDGLGRRLDFHALRKTLATRLLRSGVPTSVAKRITRHRFTHTLEKHYDGLEDTDAAAAVQNLRALGGKALEGSFTITQTAGETTGQTTGIASPAVALGCTQLQDGRVLPVLRLLIGDDGKPCYTAALSSQLHVAAPHVVAWIGEDAQVEKSWAISAVG